MTNATQPIDDEKLKSMLESHDYPGAKKLIRSFLDQELSDEEKGKIYTQIISTYLTLVNDVNKSYLDELKVTTGALKKLRLNKKKTDEELRVMELKQKLSE